MEKRRKHILGLILGLLLLLGLSLGLKSCDSTFKLPSFDTNIISNNPAGDVDNLIKGIKTPIDLSCEDAINKARAAFDSLSSDDKNKVTLLDTLKGYELQLQNLKAAGDLAGKSAADLDGLLSGIKLPLDSSGLDLLGKIRAAFDSLSSDEKAKFKGLNLLEGLELSSKGALELDNFLNGIKLPLSASDSDLLAKIRNAYEGLSDAEKAKFKGLNLLEGFELSLNGTGADLDNLLNGITLPISLEHKDLLEKIRAAYEGLSDTEKAKFTGLDKLNAYELDLSNLLNSTGQAVEDLIKAIPTPITLNSEAEINRALNAYNNLSQAEKNNVSNYNLLQDYISKFNELKNNSTPPKTGVE